MKLKSFDFPPQIICLCTSKSNERGIQIPYRICLHWSNHLGGLGLNMIDKKNAEAIARYTQAILDSTVEGICTIDLDGCVRMINRSAVNLLGYSNAEQIIGKNLNKLVHYNHANGVPYSRETCPLFSASQVIENIHLENETLWRADGKSFHAEYRSVPLREDGELIGAVITFVDNSERRKEKEELNLNRAWLSSTLRGIGDAVIATDATPEQRITFLNPVCEKITGWTSEEAKGRTLADVFNIVNEATRERKSSVVSQVLKDGVIAGLANHTILIAKDGHEYAIEDSAAPIFNLDEKIDGVVLVFRDVTEQRVLEKQKALANARVERAARDLHEFFMQAPVPMAVLEGPNFVFTLTNPLYDQLTSRKALGKPLAEAFTESEVGAYVPLVERVYRTGEPSIAREMALDLPDEAGIIRRRWLDVTYNPLRESNGLIKGVTATMYETTEQVEARKQIEAYASDLESEKKKLETIFAKTPATMALWRGRDLVFEKVNADYEALVQGRKLVGKKLVDALPELKDQDFPRILQSVFDTGIPSVGRDVPVSLVRTPGGSSEQVYFDFTYLRVEDPNGKPYGVYGHAVDVTDKVKSRAEIESAKKDAEEARVRAERANDTKSAFLANMSHEIRTPLAAILGFTDLLKDKSVNQQDRDQYLETISRSGRALTRIIDDILDLAKVESGKLEVEKIEFSLFDLLDEVMDVFRERTKLKSIFLRLNMGSQIPDRVLSDPTRLRQILINIIGNAVKFTDVGGVTIQVHVIPRTNKSNEFIIEVKDTGVGITEDQRIRLFQPFVQADNTTTRRYGGTGLGLVLSRRLAEALGGTLTSAPREDQRGSTFKISFVADVLDISPDHPHISPKQKSSVDSDFPLQGLRILIADDSPDNQFLVRKILTQKGAKADSAINGLDAFRKGLSGNYDVVLMDIQMPEMDGYEATRSLRKAGYQKPIIALTAHAMNEERARTKAAGCDGHLTKPLNKIELIEAIVSRARSSAHEADEDKSN